MSKRLLLGSRSPAADPPLAHVPLVAPVLSDTVTGASLTAKTTGSFTPVEGDLVLVVASCMSTTTTAPSLTISQTHAGVWAWTRLTPAFNALTTATTTVVFAAICPATPGAGTVTITSDRTATSWRLATLRIPDTTGIPTNYLAKNQASATPSGTVPTALTNGSMLLGVITSVMASPAVTPGTGFTERTEVGNADANSLEIEYQLLATSATAAWSACGTTGNPLLVLEIKAIAPPNAPTDIIQLAASPIQILDNSGPHTTITDLQISGGGAGTGTWSIVTGSWSKAEVSPTTGATTTLRTNNTTLTGADDNDTLTATVQYANDGLATPLTETVTFGVVPPPSGGDWKFGIAQPLETPALWKTLTHRTPNAVTIFNGAAHNDWQYVADNGPAGKNGIDITEALDAGALPVISVGVTDGGLAGPKNPFVTDNARFTTITNGNRDTAIKSVANQIKTAANGAVVMIRPGWEMNLAPGSFSWSIDWDSTSDKANYKNAFNHVAKIFKDIMPNCLVTWNPHKQTETRASLAAFYPGNTYIDDIGLDSYDANQVATVDNYTAWKDSSRFQTFFDFATIDKHLLFSCSEIGLRMPIQDVYSTNKGGADNPHYIEHVYRFCAENSAKIRFINIFRADERFDQREPRYTQAEADDTTKQVNQNQVGFIKQPVVHPTCCYLDNKKSIANFVERSCFDGKSAQAGGPALGQPHDGTYVGAVVAHGPTDNDKHKPGFPGPDPDTENTNATGNAIKRILWLWGRPLQTPIVRTLSSGIADTALSSALNVDQSLTILTGLLPSIAIVYFVNCSAASATVTSTGYFWDGSSTATPWELSANATSNRMRAFVAFRTLADVTGASATYSIKPQWGTNNVNSYTMLIIPCYGTKKASGIGPDNTISETAVATQRAAATSASLSYSNIGSGYLGKYRVMIHVLARRGNAASTPLDLTISNTPGTIGAGVDKEGASPADNSTHTDGDMRFVMGHAIGNPGVANTCSIDFNGQSKESASVSFAFIPRSVG